MQSHPLSTDESCDDGVDTMNVQVAERNRQPRLATAVPLVLLAVAGALGATLLLGAWIGHTRFAVFYAAVMYAAFLGGLRLAVLATVLSVLLVELFVIEQPLEVQDPAVVVVRALMLAALSLVGAWLVERMRAARSAAERKTAEAEELAESLLEQAQQLELQVTETEAMAAELEQVNQQLHVQTDAAQRAATRSARLQRLTGLLLDSTSEAVVARLIAGEARRAVEASRAVVALLRDEGRIEIVATDGMADGAGTDALLRHGSPLTDAVHTGEPVWITSSAALRERYGEFAREQDAYDAWVALPLLAERQHLGALLFAFEQAGEFAPEDRSFLLLLAQQCTQALERTRLQETTLRARIRAEFAERRLAFLAEASARLSESLDYHATLANLAQLTVPDLADWSLIHLRDESGTRRLVAAVHADPVKASARRQLEDRYPDGGIDGPAFEHVVRTRNPYCVEHVTDERLRSVAVDDMHYETLRAFGLRSQITVPILADDDVWGTITLASAESGRVFGDADVTLAAELGRRAGQAVSNARLYQRAHYASEAKSDFLAVMSHELRTPLNAIIGYTDLLLLGVPNEVPDRARRQVERIRSASNSLLHLVEEVLSFSRIEAGKEEIRISPVDLAALLRDAAAMVEPMAAEKSLTVELELPDEPLKVISDERKIRQVVTNLLSNAVKFTERGGIRVSAEVQPAELLVHVQDTGIGIPAEHLERIFDPFWQVEQSSTRRFGGTGLGLGVARKLALLLEGALEVESEVDVGSTFTLRLPRRTPGTGRSA